MNLLKWISITQAPDVDLLTKYTRRLCIIVKYWDLFLLEKNPNYDGMTSFANTSLPHNNYTQQQLIELSKHIVNNRFGYTDLYFDSILDWAVQRLYHKPDRDHNECWLYDGTILIFELMSTMISHNHYNRIPVWKSSHELSDYFQWDGSNGSSKLIFEQYQSNNI